MMVVFYSKKSEIRNQKSEIRNNIYALNVSDGFFINLFIKKASSQVANF